MALYNRLCRLCFSKQKFMNENIWKKWSMESSITLYLLKNLMWELLVIKVDSMRNTTSGYKQEGDMFVTTDHPAL